MKIVTIVLMLGSAAISLAGSSDLIGAVKCHSNRAAQHANLAAKQAALDRNYSLRVYVNRTANRRAIERIYAHRAADRVAVNRIDLSRRYPR